MGGPVIMAAPPQAGRFGCFSALAEASPLPSPVMRAAPTPVFVPPSPSGGASFQGFTLVSSPHVAPQSPKVLTPAQVPVAFAQRKMSENGFELLPPAMPTFSPVAGAAGTAPCPTLGSGYPVQAGRARTMTTGFILQRPPATAVKVVQAPQTPAVATPASASTAPAAAVGEEGAAAHVIPPQFRKRAATDSTLLCSLASPEAPAPGTALGSTTGSVAAQPGLVRGSTMPLATPVAASPTGTAATTLQRAMRPQPLNAAVTYVTSAAAVTASPHAAQVSPLASPILRPVWVRQLSGGPPSSPLQSPSSPPQSPKWETVQMGRRRCSKGLGKGPEQAGAAGTTVPAGVTAVAPQAGRPLVVASAVPDAQQKVATGNGGPTGDAVDLAYEQKEFFVRSGTRGAKQSWSTKQVRKTEYQVEKRKQQRDRQRAAQFAMFEGDSD